MMGKLKISIFAFCILNFAFTCYAKGLTIIYTGDAHAMLYQCSCPIERDGGVARRATLVNQLRKKNPAVLVLDAGNFFAGGPLDEYSQNSQLDMYRTLVNLKAMQVMGYDAVGISDEEFNFGREFLEKNIPQTGPKFISANIKLKGFAPYVIKEFDGLRLGITAISPLSIAKKSAGLEVREPRLALKEALAALDKERAGFIILLSGLDETESIALIKEFPQINVIILGRSHTKGDYFNRIGDTLVIKPSWQGRKLGSAVLSIEKDKIKNYEVNEIRLSEDIKDDPQVTAILPICFSDGNCKKAGLVGSCSNPGTSKAGCTFVKPPKVSVSVIVPKLCRSCDTDKIINSLKRYFPGLSPEYIYYPGSKSEKLIKDLKLETLPAFLFGKEIENDKEFIKLKQDLESRGDFYLLKPQASGIAYFIFRKASPGQLDLFISLYDKNARTVLEAAGEFNPRIHFLATWQQGGFDAKTGSAEVEEYLRASCVQKYYPAQFRNYIGCRLQNIGSSWWEDCLEGFDTKPIKACAKSEEGSGLLKENISLSEELKVMFGPTYLLDNQEIFSSSGAPDKEELRSIINKRR